MSVVETLLPPISPVVITRPSEADADDLNGVHAYLTRDPSMRPLCGAPLEFGHSCESHLVFKETTACPECGRPVCVYCRLLIP